MGVAKSIFLVLVLLVSLGGFAQDKPEVHKINGKKYYLHVVEPGNTLYGISKLYNLEVDQILAENPLVKSDGLKVNQTLLVPVTSENKKELGGLVEENKDFLVHQVQPKQTLYSVSRQYNIEIQALLDANPELGGDGLKAGSSIKVPVASIKPEKPSTLSAAAPDSLQGHIVKKGETLYSLSKQYDVDITMLKRANDGLPIGLKEGMVLRIPGLMAEVDSTLIDENAADSMTIVYEPDTSGTLDLALLFPFRVSFPDSGQKDFTINQAARVSINFYQGMKFGLDSLFQDRENPVNIHVFDTRADSGVIKDLIASNRLDSFDAICGPFYTDQYELLCDSLMRKDIPVICPIPKPSKILFKRSMAVKTTPSMSMQLHSLAELLAAEFQDSNLVLVNSNKVYDQDNLDFFKARYREALSVPDTSREEAIREIKLWDINNESLTMRFGDSGNYVLIVPSNDRVFVSQLLSGLYDMVYNSDAYHFTVIGLEGWLQMEDNLDIRHLHDLNVTLTLSTYLDYDDYKVNNLVKAYRNKNGYEPDAYAIQGFDLALYLKQRFEQEAQDWTVHPENYAFHGVSQHYYFKRITEGSGVENRYIQLYRYNQFRLKKVASWPLAKNK